MRLKAFSSTMYNLTKHVAVACQQRARTDSRCFVKQVKPPCHSLWCFCWLPLSRWVAFAFGLLEQLHESPKKGRGRAKREKGHELGLLGLAAHCATLPNT